MRQRMIVLLAAVAALALALPASAAPKPGDADFEPTLRTEATYFHCASANKVAGVDTATGNIASWNTTAPAASFTAGAGCGYYDNLLSGGTGVASAIWEGTFTGNLDSIDVELHRLVAGAGGSVTAPQLVAILTVDGAEYYNDDVAGLYWEPSSTGASESAVFSFTDIDLLTEHGDGTRSREISLTIDSYNEAQTLWVFDASEVPAGMTFNAENPAQPRVRV